MEKNKLYILCDRKLDPIYAAVQGGHAVAKWMQYNVEIKFNKFACEDQAHWKWENGYLIYLAVDIKKWWKLLNEYGAESFEQFYEPDLDNRMTSIAVWEGGLHDYLKSKLHNERTLKVA